MLFDQIVIGSAMVGLCVIIHVGAIVFLLGIMRRHSKRWLAWRFYPGATLLMLIIILGLLLAHTAEIWLWAELYIYLGEFSGSARALYFSTVTFTTLGYGDITLTEPWQLLSSLEAAGGILLFGLSTGVSVAAMMSIVNASEERDE